MFFRRVLRWLFLRGDRWINIQLMTNEIWIHPESFISTPSKHINVLSKESTLPSLEEAAELSLENTY